MRIYNEDTGVFDGDGFGFFNDGIYAYRSGFDNYKPWSGAVCRYNEIAEAGKLEQLTFILEELYPDGMSETELNDFIWFEEDMWREWLNMDGEDKD